ncbi:unnamed protein product [Mytilus edulis]|uniref:Uncharacterized protein n=1 Tax=Mytilus edulis TaxID=6550 RepID=A0A8S3QNU8_MYTED|nr:unnamed protein product [Mytilus edulis]
MEAKRKRSTIMHWIVAFGCYEFFRYAWSVMTPSKRKQILGRDYKSKPLSKSFFPLAVLGGSLNIVKELIDSGADVNCFSEFFETPLYIAVKSGSCDMVHLLLKKGAHINLRLWFDMKVPILVISNNNQLTSLILKYDLNQTKLHKAVRNNDLHILRSNISCNIIDAKTNSGWTILHYAVLSNNIEAVKILFQEELSQNDDLVLRGKPTPKVSIADNNGLTAVHLAVINNNIEILSILLRNRVDVNVRDDFDRTPLHYTTSESAIELLLTQSFQSQCFATKLNANDFRVYEIPRISVFKTTCLNIIVHTAFRNFCRDFVNVPDSEGNTPLHSVITRCLLKQQSSDCIETLLENGANPCLFNDMGISALELIGSYSDTDEYTNNKFYTLPDINTMKLTALNCTEFIPNNISCSAYNTTYTIGADFSAQCRNDLNFTSYNGTFIVESDVIDWSVMVCINLIWLHVICIYFVFYCLSVFARKVTTLSKYYGNTPKLKLYPYPEILLFFYVIILASVHLI